MKAEALLEVDLARDKKSIKKLLDIHQEVIKGRLGKLWALSRRKGKGKALAG